MLFYDAPEQPADIFDEFMAIPALTTNITTRSFLSLVQVEPTATSANIRHVLARDMSCSTRKLIVVCRGYSNTVPFEEITLPLLETIVAQLEVRTLLAKTHTVES